MTNTAHTNFAAYSHQQLYAMLQAGDPNSARHAADKWQSAARHLHEQAHNLNSELTEFAGQWTGGAAEQYQHMILDLANGISKVAQTAEAMNVMLGDAADALVKAKKEMPPPVAVPDIAPADVALAVNPPLLPPDASPAVVQAAAQQRQQAIANVEAQQTAANAAGSAHGKAIVVMTELAGQYTVAEESIPASPNAVPAPAPPPAGGGAGTSGSPGLVGNGLSGPGVVVTPTDGHPLPGGGTTQQPGTIVPTSNPLFGDMFTAGLAAASAAAFGRFGSIMPKVPSWATGKDPKDKTEEPTGTKLGGGGAGVEGGSGGGIPIGGADAPSLGGGGVSVGGGAFRSRRGPGGALRAGRRRRCGQRAERARGRRGRGRGSGGREERDADDAHDADGHGRGRRTGVRTADPGVAGGDGERLGPVGAGRAAGHRRRRLLRGVD